MSEEKNKILIVDDENVNLKVLSHILGGEYTIYTASNGASAIEKIKEYKPDLVLLDIIMPEMDGYETLSIIKSTEGISNIPVIFITGLSGDVDEAKGLSLEAADYITKPFNAVIVKLRVKNQIRIVNQFRTIERLSLIDQLTNIYNRRSFDDRLSIEWKQAMRDNKPLSILMIDIDKFKGINDTYGHQKGDVILKMIADIFPKSFRRPSDFAARWGGEEFIALLPNTHLEGAVEVAEKMRSEIENTKVTFADDVVINVTVSIGVNSLIPESNHTIDAFISGVDKALYAAKDAGRNKVISNNP